MTLMQLIKLSFAALPPSCPSWSGPRVSVGSAHGFPRLQINGVDTMATWFKVGQNDNFANLTDNRRALFEIRQAERAGVPIIGFGLDRKVHGSSSYEGGTDWLFDEDHPLDARTANRFDAVIAAAPSALLLPTVYPYFDSHTDGRSCTDPTTACEHTLLRDASNASRSRRGFSNSPSPSWVGNVSVRLRNLMCYLDRRYPGKILGVQLNGMETGEWFQEGMGGHSDPTYYGDYSNATHEEYCAGSASCRLPSPAERNASALGNTLASPEAAAFNLFLSNRTARALATLARVAKAASGGHAFVGFYFGYLFALAGRRGAGSGHLALRTLLEESAVDAVLAPYRYNYDARNATMPLLHHGPINAMRLHGKIAITEDDSRTPFCEQEHSCGEATLNLHTTRTLLAKVARTNLLSVAMQRTGSYNYDIPGNGWYGRPDEPNATALYWDALAAARGRAAALRSGSGSMLLEPQIALLADEVSAAYMRLDGGPDAVPPCQPASTDDLRAVRMGDAAGCGFAQQLLSQPSHVLKWVGAPFAELLLSDVLHANFSAAAASFKMIVLPNALMLTPEIEVAIRTKLATPGRTLLLMWAPSVLNGAGGGVDLAGPSRITGLNLTPTDTATPLVTDWAVGGAKGAYGQSYPIAPAFTLKSNEDDAASSLGGLAGSDEGLCGSGNLSILGRLSGGEKPPSLVRLDSSRCSLLFSSSPGLSADALHALALAAGVHIFTNATDVTVESAGNALLLHCARGGEACKDVHIRLPAPASRVTLDDFESQLPGKLVCAGGCTDFVLPVVAAASPVLLWVSVS
jgi:hypothetical protein